MEKTGMCESLKEQFSRNWDMLRAASRARPEAQWKIGDDDYLKPVRLAYHIIMAAERYVSSLVSEEYMKTRRYGLDWLGSIEFMPEKEQMLTDIDWMESFDSAPIS